MAAYKDLVGQKITKVTSNPGEPKTGQMWYNSTSGSLKGLGILEAWSSASPLIRNTSTGGANHALGAGIQTAAIYAGGYSPYTNKTEHYNGSGWSSGGNMNLTRITSGFGTETAAVAAGGITFPGVVGAQAEEYDGTSWTTGNALGTARAYGTGSGILTAGVFFGGSTDGGDTNTVGNTEEYDGTSWSEQNDLNSSRKMLGAAGKGPQSAALAFGGDIAPITGNTETYDGTSWTEVNNLNTARENLGGAGDQTSALAFGGVTPTASAATESWDGSSWSTSPATLANARASQPTIGTSTATMHVGGPNPSFPGGWVEEYNKSTNTITAAAWASSSATNTARTTLTGAGSQTANVIFAGQLTNPPYANQSATEEYDGSTWSEVTDYPSAVSNLSGLGTQTAALGYGGYPNVTASFEYDGTNWTSTGAMGTGRELASANIGTQTAGLTAGGYIRPSTTNSTAVEQYDGSSWTSAPALNTGLYGRCGSGTQTASLVSGGQTGSTSNATEEYNGSSWTTGNTRPWSAGSAMGSGTQTAALHYGGNPAGAVSTTSSYDGTNWATAPSMGTTRSMGGGCGAGTSTAALASSGCGPGATEEFTGETSAANITDFTTS